MGDDLYPLRLFNEKAAKLLSLSFTNTVRSGKHGVSVSLRDGAVIGMDRAGPNPEAIDAFALTFRFFIQNNEPSSIANLEAAYQRLDLDEDTKAAISRMRTRVNTYLDGPSNFGQHGVKLPRREILEVFFYGSLAHSNPAKKAVFDQWASSSVYLFIEGEFTVILTSLISAIDWFSKQNRLVLELFETDTQAC